MMLTIQKKKNVSFLWVERAERPFFYRTDAKALEKGTRVFIICLIRTLAVKGIHDFF